MANKSPIYRITEFDQSSKFAIPYVVMDIETIYNTSEEVVNRLVNSQIKKLNSHDAVIAWQKTKRDAFLEKELPRTALNALYGSVTCISALYVAPMSMNTSSPMDNKMVTYLVRPDEGVTEQDMLSEFVSNTLNFKLAHKKATIVGHNVLNFDVDFVEKRALINRVKGIKRLFPHDIKPWDNLIFDTMEQWSRKWKDYTSLSDIANALGIGDKTEIDINVVFDWYKTGQYDLYVDYAEQDVYLTNEIYNILHEAY